MRLMHVGPAHGHGADFEQDIVLSDVRNRDLAELDGMGLQGVMDDGGVGLHRLFSGKEYHFVPRSVVRGLRGPRAPAESFDGRWVKGATTSWLAACFSPDASERSHGSGYRTPDPRTANRDRDQLYSPHRGGVMLNPTGVYDRVLRRLSRRDLMKVAWALGASAVARPAEALPAERRVDVLQLVPVLARRRLRRSAARRHRVVDPAGAAAADRRRHADGAGHGAMGAGGRRGVPDGRAEGGDAGAARTGAQRSRRGQRARSRRTTTGIASAPGTRSARPGARERRPRPAPRSTGCASASAAAATTRPATSPPTGASRRSSSTSSSTPATTSTRGAPTAAGPTGASASTPATRSTRWSTTATATASTSRIPTSSPRTARRRSSSAGTITRSRTTTPATSTRTARRRRSSCCGAPPRIRRTTSTCRCGWRPGRPARTCASTGGCSSAT